MSIKLWQPDADQIAESNLNKFLGAIEKRWGFSCSDYSALHKWSVEELEKFWLSLWDFAGVLGDISGNIILRDAEKMPGAKFFPNSRLNFAENLLRQKDDNPVLIFRGETGGVLAHQFQQQLLLVVICRTTHGQATTTRILA